jgi:3-methyladenine DNA glycosylase AlkD
VRTLEVMGDPSRVEGMARYGIRTDHAVGVTVTELRRLARGLRPDHELAAALWATRVHEARILASLVDDPALVTQAQMDAWVGGFDSWDVCDAVCGNLFDRTPFALDKAIEWSRREPEFERRAGFALMAWAAVHRKELPDRAFATFLPRIREASMDDRTYVRKAVSWALRQIGKRSRELNSKAILAAEQIGRIDAGSSRWVARDTLRELRGDALQARLGARRA